MSAKLRARMALQDEIIRKNLIPLGVSKTGVSKTVGKKPARKETVKERQIRNNAELVLLDKKRTNARWNEHTGLLDRQAAGSPVKVPHPFKRSRKDIRIAKQFEISANAVLKK
jgi:hypothetical protein